MHGIAKLDRGLDVFAAALGGLAFPAPCAAEEGQCRITP